MQEIIINIPDTMVTVGGMALAGIGGAVAGAKLWWYKKTKEQKFEFVKAVEEAGQDGFTIKEILDIAEKHL